MAEINHIASDLHFFQLDALYLQSFGASSVPTAVLKSWWTACPQGLLGLFENDTVIGGMSIWPLLPTTFDAFAAGNLKERDISVSDLDPQSENRFYISEIAIAASHRKPAHLLALLNLGLSTLTNSKLPDMRILALGYSEAGIIIMRRYGFELLLPATATADQMPLYLWKKKN